MRGFMRLVCTPGPPTHIINRQFDISVGNACCVILMPCAARSEIHADVTSLMEELQALGGSIKSRIKVYIPRTSSPDANTGKRLPEGSDMLGVG